MTSSRITVTMISTSSSQRLLTGHAKSVANNVTRHCVVQPARQVAMRSTRQPTRTRTMLLVLASCLFTPTGLLAATAGDKASSQVAGEIASETASEAASEATSEAAQKATGEVTGEAETQVNDQASLPASNRKQGLVLRAEQWESNRNGEQILSLPVINKAVNHWLAEQGALLEILYPGGEEGELWVRELSDWLISLGIPSTRIIMSPGSGGDDIIRFRRVAPYR